MEFLPQQNKRQPGRHDSPTHRSLATGKDVIIIGGGDTGSDCTGTSNRQGCASVTQFELLPQPPDLGHFPARSERPAAHALALLADDAPHQHLARRRLRPPLEHSDQGVPGRRRRATCKSLRHGEHRVVSTTTQGRQTFREVARHRKGLAVPVGAAGDGLRGAREARARSQSLGLELDPRGNVKCDANYMSSVDGVFAAGDMRRGQSLVVWAIHEGREAARAIDKLPDGRHAPAQRQRRRFRLALTRCLNAKKPP